MCRFFRRGRVAGSLAGASNSSPELWLSQPRAACAAGDRSRTTRGRGKLRRQGIDPCLRGLHCIEMAGFVCLSVAFGVSSRAAAADPSWGRLQTADASASNPVYFYSNAPSTVAPAAPTPTASNATSVTYRSYSAESGSNSGFYYYSPGPCGCYSYAPGQARLRPRVPPRQTERHRRPLRQPHRAARTVRFHQMRLRPPRITTPPIPARITARHQAGVTVGVAGIKMARWSGSDFSSSVHAVKVRDAFSPNVNVSARRRPRRKSVQISITTAIISAQPPQSGLSSPIGNPRACPRIRSIPHKSPCRQTTCRHHA